MVQLRPNNYELIIFGLGRFGGRLAKLLEDRTNVKFLGVDFDPTVVKNFRKKPKHCIWRH